MTSRRQWLIAIGVAGWLIAAAGGMTMLMGSTRRPDPAADERPAWPAEVELARAVTGTASATGPTLIVCLHPRCPCSDATLDALETLLASSKTATAYALFALPDAAPAGWADADLVARARTIPGLRVVLDRGGRQCSALGAKSSGQTFLYDASGRLSFAGGLTPGRGERGEVDGTRFIADALSGLPAPRQTLRTDVFGCALYRGPKGGVQ